MWALRCIGKIRFNRKKWNKKLNYKHLRAENGMLEREMHAICSVYPNSASAADGSILLINLWIERKKNKQQSGGVLWHIWWMSVVRRIFYGQHFAGGHSIADRFYVSISFASNVPENHGNISLRWMNESHCFVVNCNTYCTIPCTVIFWPLVIVAFSVCRFNVLFMWNFHKIEMKIRLVSVYVCGVCSFADL